MLNIVGRNRIINENVSLFTVVFASDRVELVVPPFTVVASAFVVVLVLVVVISSLVELVVPAFVEVIVDTVIKIKLTFDDAPLL